MPSTVTKATEAALVFLINFNDLDYVDKHPEVFARWMKDEVHGITIDQIMNSLDIASELLNAECDYMIWEHKNASRQP